MPNITDQHIIIIGAGMSHHSIPFSIYDSDPSLATLRAGDWGIAVHWAIPHIEECLPPDLFQRLREAQVDPSHEPDSSKDSLPIYNGQTHELLKRVEVPKFYRLSRKRTRSLCAEGISINFGKRLTDIETSPASKTVTAIFADSTHGSGTLLIGTDGPRSSVRTHLLGPRASLTPLPYTVVRLLATYPDPTTIPHLRNSIDSINGMALHPQGSYAFFSANEHSLDKSPEEWRVQLMYSYRNDIPEAAVKQPLDVAKSRMQEWAEPWKGAWSSLGEGTEAWSSQLSFWKPVAWDGRGRITLAGDACHPMTFHRGQGLNYSIADAAGFVQSIARVCRGEEEIVPAMGGYEADMIERGAAEVEMSWENTQMLHNWDDVMHSPLFQRGSKKVE
ncbi:MAG: hypothetical protein MMC23_004318 [Stictis urceolatum]|nr:hypothetical protein [Stictis urceolata]